MVGARRFGELRAPRALVRPREAVHADVRGHRGAPWNLAASPTCRSRGRVRESARRLGDQDAVAGEQHLVLVVQGGAERISRGGPEASTSRPCGRRQSEGIARRRRAASLAIV